MGKPGRFPLDLYGAVLHVAADRKQWALVRREVKGAPKSPDATGLTHITTWVPTVGIAVTHLLVFVNVKDHAGDTGALVNTVAHEAAHAAGSLLDGVEQRYDGGTEAHAYLVGWVAERVWRHCVVDGGG